MAGTLTRVRPRRLTYGKRTSNLRIQSSAIRQIFSGIQNRMHYVPPLQDSRALIERIRDWVYVCVDKNATEVSRTTLRLYTKNGKKAEKAGYVTKSLSPKRLTHLKAVNPTATDECVEIEDHRILDVLAAPTPLLDGCNLLWLITAYLQLFGETYLYKGRNNLGVAEVWPMPNQYMKKILGPKSMIDAYEYHYAGQMQRFPADDMCLIRKPSPVDMIAALGPLKAMLQSVETIKRYGEWQNAIFQNYCIPDTLLIPEDDSVSGDQVDELAAQWESEHGGWRQRGGVDFMPYKLRVEQLGMNLKELQGTEQAEALRDEVMAGFGVPPTIATTNGATFANMKQGVQLWARQTIGAYLITIAHGLNRTLLPEFMGTAPGARPTAFLAFDDPIPEDEAADTEVRIKRIRGGLLTVNQGLEQEGRLSVEGGDETLIEAGLVKLTDPTQAELQQAQQATDAVWRTEDNAREDVRVEYQQRVDGEAAEQERQATETRDRLVAEGMTAGGGGVADVPGAEATGDGQTPVGVEPPTFNELTLGLERMSHIGDLIGTNIMRQALADRLGVSIEPLTELVAASSAADVDPDGKGNGDKPKDDDGKPDKPEDEKKPPRDEKPKPGGKAGDGGSGVEVAGESVGREHTSSANGQPGSGVYGQAVGGDEPGTENVSHAVVRQCDIFRGFPERDHCCGTVTKLALEDADPPDGAFAKVLQKLFREMEAEVKDKLSLVVKAIRDVGIRKGEWEARRQQFLPGVKAVIGGAELFNEDEWIKRFADESQPFILEPLKEGAKAGFRDLERLGFEVPHGKPESREELEALLISPEIAQQEALKLVDEFSSKVVEITGEDLADAIIGGLDEGENLGQITKRVAEMYDRKVDVASKRIARTEVNNAANAGAAAQWRNAGIRQHKWLASSDACEFCAELANKVVNIGEPFARVGDTIIGKDGGRFRLTYRDVLQPGLHPNDRCTTIPVIEVLT